MRRKIILKICVVLNILNSTKNLILHNVCLTKNQDILHLYGGADDAQNILFLTNYIFCCVIMSFVFYCDFNDFCFNLCKCVSQS